jgi:hypothetical protein
MPVVSFIGLSFVVVAAEDPCVLVANGSVARSGSNDNGHDVNPQNAGLRYFRRRIS